MWLQATSTQAPPTLLIFSACSWRIWPSQWQAALGAFSSLELCSSLIVPRQWWEQLQSCFWQHLPVFAHWPRSTVYRGWQWVRSSGSSLSGNASYQLSQSNLGGICWSWSCDDASHQHDLSLPGDSCACQCRCGHGSHGPKVSGSPSVWMACWWLRCKTKFKGKYNKLTLLSLLFFFFSTCEHLMNSPLCGFKLPAHKPHQHS